MPPFFCLHSAPAAFEAVRSAGKPTYSTFENEWGKGRTSATASSGGERSDDWKVIKRMIALFWDKDQYKVLPHQSPGRLKQWSGLMRRSYPQAEALNGSIRELRLAPDIGKLLSAALLPQTRCQGPTQGIGA